MTAGAAEVVARLGKLEAREEIEIGPGSPRATLTLPFGVEVSGWIFDDAGDPVPAATVAFDTHGLHSEAISAADGRFTLADVPPGSHRLAVRHPRFAPYVSESRIEVGTEPVVGVVRLRCRRRNDPTLTPDSPG